MVSRRRSSIKVPQYQQQKTLRTPIGWNWAESSNIADRSGLGRRIVAGGVFFVRANLVAREAVVRSQASRCKDVR